MAQSTWAICPELRSEADADAYAQRLGLELGLEYCGATQTLRPGRGQCASLHSEGYEVSLRFRRLDDGAYVVQPHGAQAVVRTWAWPLELRPVAAGIDDDARLLLAMVAVGCVSVEAGRRLSTWEPEFDVATWRRLMLACRRMTAVRTWPAFEVVAADVLALVDEIV